MLTSNIEPVVTRNGFSLMSVSFDAYKGKEYKQKTRFLVPSAMRLSVRGRRVNICLLYTSIFTELRIKDTIKQPKSFGRGVMRKEIYTKRNTKGCTV